MRLDGGWVMARYGSGPILGPLVAGLTVTVGGIAAVAVLLDVPVTAETGPADGLARPQPTLQAMIDPGAVATPNTATDASEADAASAVEAKPVKLRPAGPLASDRPVRQIMPLGSGADHGVVVADPRVPRPPSANTPPPPPPSAPAVVEAQTPAIAAASSSAAEQTDAGQAPDELAAVATDDSPVPRPRPPEAEPVEVATAEPPPAETDAAEATDDAAPRIEDLIEAAHAVAAEAPKPAADLAPADVALAGASISTLATSLSAPTADSGSTLAAASPQPLVPPRPVEEAPAVPVPAAATAAAAPAESPAAPVEVAAVAPPEPAAAPVPPPPTQAELAPPVPVENGQTFARVVVRDARTLFATTNTGAVTYSLQYVKAPEFSETCKSGDTVWRCGAFARAALSSRIGQTEVTCGKAGGSSITPGRISAVCVSGGVDMALWLVNEGLAVPADGAPEAYRDAAANARKAGRGLWGDTAPAGAATVKGISTAAAFQVPAE